MKFVIKVKDKGDLNSQAWEEEYDTEKGKWMIKRGFYNGPNEYGLAIVDYWNANLRRGDKPREFISVRIGEISEKSSHD